MVKREKLIPELGEFLSALSTPLCDSEIANGWTEQSQAAISKFFAEIQARLLAGESPDRDVLRGTIRGLDHWGVEGGPMFERACTLSNRLLELED